MAITSNSPQSTSSQDNRDIQIAKQQLGPSKEALALMSDRTKAILSGRSPLNRDVNARGGFDPRYEKIDGQYSANRLSRNNETQLTTPVRSPSQTPQPQTPVEAPAASQPAPQPQRPPASPVPSPASTPSPSPSTPSASTKQELSAEARAYFTPERIQKYDMAWRYKDLDPRRVLRTYNSYPPETQALFREYAKYRGHDWSKYIPGLHEEFINNLSNYNQNGRMEPKDVRNLMDAYGSIYETNDNSEFETWVDQLVQEGYDLSDYTWDDMHQIYMENVEQINEGRRTSLSALSHESAQRKADKERGRPETEAETHGRLMMGDFRPGASPEERARGGRQRLKDRGKVPQKGGKDMFEQVLEYLMSEGYADTEDHALVIMANMSEEWRNSILSEGTGIIPAVSNLAANVLATPRETPAGIKAGAYRIGKAMDAVAYPIKNVGAAALRGLSSGIMPAPNAGETPQQKETRRQVTNRMRQAGM